jgi:cobaltochelatase CobN
VLDEEMRQRLSENNPYAAREIAEKLAETLERGYFELTEEEYEQFRDAVLEMEAWIEEET